MVKIEWVEIPAGEFLAGLSEQQAAGIRTKARADAAVDKLSDDEQAQVEHEIARYLSWLEDRETDGFHSALIRDPRFAPLSRVEASLHQVPPQRVIDLPTFYIARFPVTHEQMGEFFAAFAGNAALQKRRLYLDERSGPPDFPEDVYWDVADAFCHWVGGRLPTALEWEKAARGTDGRLYPWGNEWDPSRGNLIPDTNAPGRPERARGVPGWATPVDGYPSGVSPYGVWDMAGNLAEWTMTTVEEWVKVKANEWEVWQAFTIKGCSPKDLPPPSWYYHILPHQTLAGAEAWPRYIGFRPVKDEWQREHWQGFCVERDGKS